MIPQESADLSYARATMTRRWNAWWLSLILGACSADRPEGRPEGQPTGASETTAVSTTGSGSSGSGGTASAGSGSGDNTSSGGADAPGIDDDAPLGAQLDASGRLHLAVRSGSAERIEAWLYAESFGASEALRVVLEPREGDLFRGVVSSMELAEAGLDETIYYGLRAWGPGWGYDPAWTPGGEVGFVSDVTDAGHRFNPNKLLLDPYAREMSHDPFHAAHSDGFVYVSGPEHRATDSGPAAPKGIVIAEPESARAWGRPELKDLIVYEVHLRGFTKADPALPESSRGTYAGAASKAAYLADLGVSAVELLPLHETQNQQNDLDPMSAEGDNYWGYSSLSFFAPERRFASDPSPGGPTRELKEMIEAFHAEGVSVIVDVVFNHTGEGGPWNAAGDVAPFFSWRGLDNPGYYQLGDDSAHYQNDNGVGPNLAATSPLARDMVLDALRYWHETLGVDGFRFDLAPILANGCEHGCFSFDPDDPEGILRRARDEMPDAWLIAEPWGIGAGTYQLGMFPEGWAEWNGEYRDLIRDDQNRMESAKITPGWLADRLGGSWSLFGDDGREPWRSINLVVAHDGMTHADLYRCNVKDNDQAWPYGPSDGGTDDDRAWDQGGDPVAQRHAARTGMALLMVSAGVPMITGGDEWLRSQKCNNNPYNLDSPGTWLDWSGPEAEPDFQRFARSLMRFRNAHPALRPSDYRQSTDGDGNGLPSIAFFRDDGEVANAGYLDDYAHHVLAFRVDGEEAGDPARSIFVAYNGWDNSVSVTLPPTAGEHAWYLVSDTHPWLESEGNFHAPGSEPKLTDQQVYMLGPRSLIILLEQA